MDTDKAPKSLKIGTFQGMKGPPEQSSASLAFKKSEELKNFEQQCFEYIQLM